MQFAMEALVNIFEEETGIACEIIVSSSGKLTAQIKEGAPYHIFVSADMKYPEDLYKAGFSTAKPAVYAHGNLVMWSTSLDSTLSIESLQHKKIKHIAIANPQTAPYGAAALATLKYYKIYTAVKEKLVYGESISQTNQFIISSAAEVGFTAKSVVLSPRVKVKGQWVSVNSKAYTPIKQGIILIKTSDEIKPKALQFYILKKS